MSHLTFLALISFLRGSQNLLRLLLLNVTAILMLFLFIFTFIMHELVLVIDIFEANLCGNSRTANKVLLAGAIVWMLNFLVTTPTYLATVMSRSCLPLLISCCNLSSL